MKAFTISSTFNLCYRKAEEFVDYVRDGMAFYRAHGVEAAELSTTALALSSDGWKKQVEEMITVSEQEGIPFTSAHLPFVMGGGTMSAESMALFDQKMHNAIDAAAQLGVGYAVLHPNSATMLAKDFNRTEQYDLVMKHLAPYVEHANRVGLPIALENMRIKHDVRYVRRYCQNPDELCEVADALGVGVCWDFGHANISGIKQSDGLAYVGKRLLALHVNDNMGIDDDHMLPFMGNVDWRDAMHGLVLADYHGIFNFEINVGRIPEALRASFTGHLVKIAQELISYVV